MSLNLRLNLCLFSPFRNMCGCVFFLQKMSPYIFFHFWQSSGAGYGPFLPSFFFLIQQMFTISFLFHSTGTYCCEASSVLFSLLTTSKTQKMSRLGEKQISISSLHLSKPIRPVANANKAVWLAQQEGRWIPSLFCCWNQHVCNCPSLHIFPQGVMSGMGNWKAKLFPKRLILQEKRQQHAHE